MEEERVPKQILANSPQQQMSAIILFGGCSCGKSSTLQHLIVLLCGGGKIVQAIQTAFEDTFYDPKHDCYHDCDVVVHYTTKKGYEVTIYVSTDGDSWPVVEDNFRFFYHCIRRRHKVYKFDGKRFVQVSYNELKEIDSPSCCVTAASFTKFGGIQAAHYYFDLTCEDWQHNCWIRKYQSKNLGSPVPGYNKPKHQRIWGKDDELAGKIVILIDKMITD